MTHGCFPFSVCHFLLFTLPEKAFAWACDFFDEIRVGKLYRNGGKTGNGYFIKPVNTSLSGGRQVNMSRNLYSFL
jgi:hypothetical protein